MNVSIYGRKADARKRIEKYTKEARDAQAALAAAKEDLQEIEQEEVETTALAANAPVTVTLVLSPGEARAMRAVAVFNVSIPTMVKNEGGNDRDAYTFLAKLMKAYEATLVPRR